MKVRINDSKKSIKAEKIFVTIGNRQFQITDDEHSSLRLGPHLKMIVYAHSLDGHIATGTLVVYPVGSNVIRLDIER